MLRTTAIVRLARTLALPGAAMHPGDSTRPVIGPKGTVPEVEFRAATSPLKAKIEKVNGQKVSVARVVNEMMTTLNRACAAKNTDRGVVSAPCLGYKARILVVRSGLDRRVLINPVVKLTSHQKIHAWAFEGDEVYRVERARSIAVKYTTADGDDETWYAMPLEESEAVQRHLDLFDGFTVGDRVSPLGVGAPSALAADVQERASHGVVPREMFRAHEGLLMRLVEAVPRSALADAL